MFKLYMFSDSLLVTFQNVKKLLSKLKPIQKAYHVKHQKPTYTEFFSPALKGKIENNNNNIYDNYKT